MGYPGYYLDLIPFSPLILPKLKTAISPIGNLIFNQTAGILQVRIIKDSEMNLENIKSHYEIISKLLSGQDYFALVDASNYILLEKEAWEFSSSIKNFPNRKAIAFYNACLANKLTISFFQSTFKESIPVEVFNSKEEAMEWLKIMSKP